MLRRDKNELHGNAVGNAGQSRTLTRRAFAGMAAAAATLRAAPSKPNIVFILADDLGYGDIGAYGNRSTQTPNLDRLAKEGVRFTDFHSNGPMCTPTRAALMSGRYQNRFGKEFEGPLSSETDHDRGLPLETCCIAKVMKEAGYATAMYGKWHLGYRPPYLPPSFGFDDFRGLASGDGDHISHINRSGRKDWWHNNRIEMEEGYSADLVTKHSVDFIAQNKERPFFLYVPHQVIHFPWQVPTDKGYRVEGKNYYNPTKLGLLESKDVGARIREMVMSVDDSAGRIMAALEQHGLTEKTLVFFTSDNGGYLTYQGGYHNISSNGPLRGQKSDVFEGGHRVPAIARWPGHIRPGVCGETAMTFDLFPTFAGLGGARDRAWSLGLDGVSLNGLLLNRSHLPERTLFWRMHEKKAVRQGDWKLVVIGAEEPQLYNLKDDLGETKNLASAQPKLTAELLRKLEHWEADVDRRK